MAACPGRAPVVFVGCMGCTVLCAQGYHLRLADTPQPLNTNQNPPKLPPWAAPAHRDVLPRPARSSQPNWLRWWGEVVSNSQQKVMCQTSLGEGPGVPGQDVTTTTLCVGTANIYRQPLHELAANWVHTGNVGRAFGVIFGPYNEAGDRSLLGSSWPS